MFWSSLKSPKTKCHLPDNLIYQQRSPDANPKVCEFSDDHVITRGEGEAGWERTNSLTDDHVQEGRVNCPHEGGTHCILQAMSCEWSLSLSHRSLMSECYIQNNSPFNSQIVKIQQGPNSHRVLSSKHQVPLRRSWWRPSVSKLLILTIIS